MSADQLDELPTNDGRKNSGGGNLVPVLIAIVLAPVSYTHLTLPTNREV